MLGAGDLTEPVRALASRLWSMTSDEGWLAAMWPFVPAWLHRRREDWAAAGQPWDACCQAWATHEGLHTGRAITRALDARFDRRLWTYGPYFFADLLDTTEADEQAAIDAGQI